MKLHSDLRRYLERDSIFGYILRHPLVFSVPYLSPLDEMLNQQYEYKKQALSESLQDKNYHKYIFLHERPYRFDALREVIQHLDPVQYWNLFKNIWTDYEFISSQVDVSSFLDIYPNPRQMMDDSEKEVFDLLPDKVKIYRGYSTKMKGFSWTLCFHQAKWFSLRFKGKTSGGYKVVSAIVDKNDIISYINPRGEKEIIVDPSKVKIFNKNHTLSINKRYARAYEIAQKLSKQNMQYTSHIHGLDHWLKVEQNVLELCRLNPEADRKVCRYFAIFHDCCRMDDEHDEHHGYRASKTLKDNKHMMPNLTSKQIDKLLYAIEFHNHGFTSDDQTIGTCWDADRLDLIRVGIVPDRSKLSTEVAKHNLFRI